MSVVYLIAALIGLFLSISFTLITIFHLMFLMYVINKQGKAELEVTWIVVYPLVITLTVLMFMLA